MGNNTMTWKIKKTHEQYLVYCPNKGSFILNNKHDAEKLKNKLNQLTLPYNEFGDILIEAGDNIKKLGEAFKQIPEEP